MPARRSGPLHARVASDLRGKIAGGRLAPGSSLPSEAQLCAEYGVSRGTVRQAIAALRAEGLVGGGRGKPPVVRRSGLAQSFDSLMSFSAWARETGHHPGARTIDVTRRRPRAQEALQLGLGASSWVYAYTRVRTLDGEPVMVERAAFVEEVGRLLLDFDLDAGSVYEQIAARGVVMAGAEHRIEAVPAGAADAELLDVARRTARLQVLRRAIDPTGRPLEWAADRYRGDAFAITVRSDADRQGAVAFQTPA
ncbi:MAG TPA: GntR family transcriptional regulator [Solirubrobacteraceae bacterium]|nr:GntR family transcriptional regulator [Solirubrobacteraceae bacterium]